MKARRILSERLLMKKLWGAFRSVIADTVVPGSGGIVMLGDSITHFGRWELLFPDLKLRNFGIGGERSEHLLQRLDPLLAIRPEKIFILIGTNDLGGGWSPHEIAHNVETLVVRLKSELPGCPIHLQGVMPRARKLAAKILALNAEYLAIAQKHGLTYIDLFTPFDDGSGELRAELTYDRLHLNGAGYAVWREILTPYLR